MLKNMIRTKLNLDNIVATDYCFSNRCKKCTRHIQNLDEIINATRIAHPNIHFKTINDFVVSFKDVTKTWAKIKFLFAPTGSNIAKGYFMQDNSVIVSVITKMGDFSILSVNAMNKVFILQYYALNLEHWKDGGGNISVSDSLRCIDAGFYCLEHKKWPSSIVCNP
jgi:hypothetical protein